MGNKGYEVSVVILTYNPNLRKYLLTLQSILLQRDVKVQIVISDDGSNVNYCNEAKDFLEKKYFDDYDILIRSKNSGMVAGTYDALEFCQGKYIKIISPGDYLHGYHALRDWIDFMEQNKLGVSYVDAIYYQWQNNKIKPVHAKLNPQRHGGVLQDAYIS